MDMTVANLLSDIVKIPSVNPDQAGPRSGQDAEQAMADWLADRADALGAAVEVEDVADGRPNVYARFEGESDRAVTIDVHIDTVGVEHMTRDPFDGAIEDGRVYGRGSVDTKATLAVVLTVFEELKARGKRPLPTVNLVGTVAEEAGGFLGALQYQRWLTDRGQRVNQMVVAEPTMAAPVYGHKGSLGLEVAIRGHAAHSSKPHLGQTAISAAARVVVAIDAEQARLAAGTPATPVGVGTLSVLEISGGLARNIIPDACEMFVGRRTAPGEDPKEITEQMSNLIREAAAPLETDVVQTYQGGLAAFYQDPDSPLVRTLADLGGTQPDTADYGSNALMYPDVADEIAVFGPGSIDQAHQAVEWVDISELELCAEVYRRFLT